MTIMNMDMEALKYGEGDVKMVVESE